MELHTKTLDIMFRRLSPEQLVKMLVTGGLPPVSDTYRELFLQYAETTLGGYSRNEQENILRRFCPESGAGAAKRGILPPFLVLCKVADEFLTPGAEGPKCRFEQLINWRDAYLLLGQDLFICAWLAQMPDRRLRRNFFSWPVTIPCDNRILEKLSEGAAENHMHLYAGASVFSLSWICAMNHPCTKAFDKSVSENLFSTYLQAHQIRDASLSFWPMRKKMLYAAFLRACLFSFLHGDTMSLLQRLHDFYYEYGTDDAACAILMEEIDALRHLCGVRFPQPTFEGSACLDYAFTRELSAEQEQEYRLLAGERHFLFSCFRAVFQGGFGLSEQWVLYLYVLLKAQIRSEFVQVNNQVGFANFLDYDSRKKLIWKAYPEYFNEDIRQSVNAAIKEQRLRSLEGRIGPEMDFEENIESVYKIDRASLFFSADTKGRAKLRMWETCSCMENLARDERYFFVVHFPKRPDEELSKDLHASPVCRHDDYRQRLRSCGIELAKALVNCQYYCERIRGIDACTQEIGCRPEVFATLFRFLRSFRPEDYWSGMLQPNYPTLSATYHVGEDFLDIADGLRAMDEALCFLDFRHGDRFGHALALGVDPVLHYRCKFNQSVMPKQDLLDNLVWIYYRSSELQVVIPETLRRMIRTKTYELFAYIYGKEAPERCYTLREYYDSMFLRGDDPRCYRTGEYRPVNILDQYDLFCVTPVRDELHPLDEYRNNKRLAELYFLYQYSLPAKRRGQETEIWTIDTAYLNLMKDLQEAMREYISRKGISIECNPSSNVLIGTIGSYQDHPILAFNTMGLGKDNSATQMHVSINSDDPGVFDTTVSFEYALLARALCSKENENGDRLYSERQIEDYLRNVVRMGNEQVFPPCYSLSSYLEQKKRVFSKQ